MQNRVVIKASGRGCFSLATRLAPGAALGFALGCATAPPPEEVPSAEGYYRRGIETLEGERVLLLFRDVDYQSAIELFQEVIDNYPYSEYSTLAELKIADVYFEQERFEEAASYFQDFVELHPTHPQVPYAIYQLGLCSFRRMHGVDRDPGPTQEALAQFRVLLERYPGSEHASDAREKIEEVENRLAAHGLEVGDFYFARGEYYAAERRYREVLEAYPHHRDRLHTLYRLARALQLTARPAEAQAILLELQASQPDGDLAEDVEETLRELNGSAGRL
jgi:outer membrane protein assembly factor BamD